MAGVLTVNPALVFFRLCVVDGTIFSSLYMRNTGDAALSVTSAILTTGTKFAVVWAVPLAAPPFALNPGDGAQINIMFQPVAGDENTLLSDTLTIVHTGSNTPVTVAVSGWGAGKGRSYCSLSPSSWSFNWYDGQDFHSGIGIDQISNELHLQIVSSGDKPLTVFAINALYPLDLVNPPILPVVLSPGTSLLVTVVCTADLVGAQNLTDNLEIYNDGPISPDIHISAYIGIALTSAYNVTGGMTGMLAFGAAEKSSQLGASCEADASFRQNSNLQSPLVDKAFTKFRFKYENLGVATVSLAGSGDSQGTIATSVAIGTVGADNSIMEGEMSFHAEGETFLMTLTVAGGAGPVSITELNYLTDEGLEFTAFDGLAAVVSAYSLAGTAPGCLLAFGANTWKADPLDLNSEEIASFTRTHDFQLTGQEKHVPRLRLKFEDLGVATISVVAKTKRETSAPVSVTFGTVGADKLIKWAQADLAINEEIIEFTVSRAGLSGPLSFTEQVFGFVERGEVIEGT